VSKIKKKVTESQQQSELISMDSDQASNLHPISFLSQWGLASIGLIMLILLLFDQTYPAIVDPWMKSIKILDSAEHIQDIKQKIAIIEQCGSELREQVAIHPYHGRIWFFYGRYFMLKENWDSCIVTFKKALTIGKGATVNSIEDMSQKMLYNALTMKLKQSDIQRDSSLNIIAQAEIPGYLNPYMNILKGLVYNRSGEYQMSEYEFKKYIDARPKDPEGYRLIANIYHYEGKETEANACMQKSQALSGTKLETFNQTIPH
jgi:tetratricopeptide (TPR) repeat protein